MVVVLFPFLCRRLPTKQIQLSWRSKRTCVSESATILAQVVAHAETDVEEHLVEEGGLSEPKRLPSLGAYSLELNKGALELNEARREKELPFSLRRRLRSGGFPLGN